jgi:hypothetical protein
MLVLTTSQEEKAVLAGGARALTSGGPVTAFLSVLLYGAVIALVLWLNLSNPSPLTT